MMSVTLHTFITSDYLKVYACHDFFFVKDSFKNVCTTGAVLNSYKYMAHISSWTTFQAHKSVFILSHGASVGTYRNISVSIINKLI